MDNVTITQAHADRYPEFADRVGQSITAKELAAAEAKPRPEKVS